MGYIYSLHFFVRYSNTSIVKPHPRSPYVVSTRSSVGRGQRPSTAGNRQVRRGLNALAIEVIDVRDGFCSGH